MKRRAIRSMVLAAMASLCAGSVYGAALEEVVVTAQKREQRAQDVPTSVSAFSDQQIERSGMQDMRDLTVLSPSFDMNSSQTESQGSTLRLRGVGTTGNNIGLESAVGVFLDGVFLSRPGVALGDMFDVERIEVLRGPQGTLFGRNTSAGAISITTKEPLLDEREFWANGTVQNFDGYDVEVGGSAPIIENTLGFRIAGAVRERDGFIDSVASGAESMNRDRWSVRGQMLWLPTPNMDVKLIADYADADENCCDGAIVRESPAIAALKGTGAFEAAGLPSNAGVIASGEDALDDRETNADEFENPFEQWGLSLELNWDLQDVGTLTYIGSFRDFEADSVQDSEFVALDLYSVRPSEANGFATFDEIDTWTHELRLQGVNGPLEWMVGGYYLDEEIVEQQGLGLGTDFGPYFNVLSSFAFAGADPALNAVPMPGSPGFATFGDVRNAANPAVAFAGGFDPADAYAQNVFEQQTESWSVFTHNTLTVAENFDVVLGLRWTDEEKDGTFDQLETGAPVCQATSANLAALGAADADAAADLGGAVGGFCFPFSSNVGPSLLNLEEFDETFSDEELIYTIRGVYRVNPDVRAYASFTHGFKSGGFNLDATAAAGGSDPRFDSELVDAYEVGVKSELFQRSLRANLALFHMEMEDFQVLEFTGIQFQTFNVDEAESTGLELELLGSPLDNLDVTFNWTWADAEYPSDCAPDDAPAQPRALCGNDLTNAPEHVIVTGVNYDQVIPNTDLNWFVNASVRWEDDHRTATQAVEIEDGVVTDQPAPNDIQDSNAKADLRLGLGDMTGLWTVELWGNNIFDEQTKNVTFNTPLRPGSRGVYFDAPRTYGLTLRTQM
ncbi:MAG: TonB-dependent receptor [Pseudomonadota bacterium]